MSDPIEPERRISDTLTIASGKATIPSEKAPSEKTATVPVRKYNLAITFLGIQISLFLAALDRYNINKCLCTSY